MDDSGIVELYLSRSERAISETSEKYGKSLYNLSNNIINNPSDAEECTNDTYLCAWNSIPPNEPRDYLFAYLARIVRHITLDRLKAMRTKKRDSVVIELTHELEECLPAADSIESRLNEKELAELISSFLRNLDLTERHIFIHRYFFAESISQLCEKTGFSHSKMVSMLFRTRKSLAKYLKEAGIWM